MTRQQEYLLSLINKRQSCMIDLHLLKLEYSIEYSKKGFNTVLNNLHGHIDFYCDSRYLFIKETVQAETVQAEAVQAEAVQAEAVQAEAVQAESIRALVICERSQTLTTQLRNFGIDAYSLDIDASYCKDESMHQYHIESCYKEFLEYRLHEINPLVIYAFTPCIYLSNAGLKHYSLAHNSLEKVNARKEKREQDLAWFLHLLENQYAKHVCLENPVGYVNSHLKPSQIVHPHFFGAKHNKRTCLWLKNLPTIKRTHYLKDDEIVKNWIDKQGGGNQVERSRRRSKLDHHFAYQIARQHSEYLKAIYR